MEGNTVVALSLISEATYCYLWLTNAPDQHLQTYTGEVLNIKGSAEPQWSTKAIQKENLSLLVLQGDSRSLLGRDWLWQIKLNWTKL